MIYTPHHCALILAGLKTQTRRLVKEGDQLFKRADGTHGVVRTYDVGGEVRYASLRSWRWLTRHTYAIQPGRGKKAIGRIRLIDIRRERLQDISDEDCKAEGYPGCLMRNVYITSPQEQFRDTWDRLHKRKSERWEANPDVWVLEFEVVK